MSAYTYAETALRALIEREQMETHLARGALLALSGGKDSVLLLSLFRAYAEAEGIPFAALHLHHGIRGAEADRDADFCRTLCADLGVPLTLVHRDVPALADASGEGLEAAARRVRYAVLTEQARKAGFSAILTAHTATDHAETVLFQLLRGGGTRALCGIPPVRTAGEGLMLLRPLLSLTQEEVLAALAERGLPYVTDSTNADDAFSRNYLRGEILPRLSRLTPAPERAFLRMTENVREDAALLDGLAEEAYQELCDGESLDAEGFLALPAALRFRVFRRFHAQAYPDAPVPERTHLDALTARLKRAGDFSFSLPGGVSLLRRDGRLSSSPDTPFAHPDTSLSLGCNRLADGSLLWVLDESTTPPPAIVYTLSTQRVLTSAKIDGGLFVRSRKEGDAYRFGGMTHKVKKMLCDSKLPRHLRDRVPVVCDARGILWVPPFGGRDDGVPATHPLTLVYLTTEHLTPAITDLLSEEIVNDIPPCSRTEREQKR